MILFNKKINKTLRQKVKIKDNIITYYNLAVKI